MTYKKVFLVTATFLILLTIKSCKYSGTGPTIDNWEFLGFDDKFALRLVLSEPYLYVCAGSDGVWRKNIRQSGIEWECIGLRDTTLGRYTNVGAVDMDVLGEDVLVASNGSIQHVPPESTVSIWRTTNGGTNWFRSDSGIPETITNPYECNVINSLQLSPHRIGFGLAVIGPAIYQSTNNAQSWQLIQGRRDVAANSDMVRWNPFRVGEAWFFGETSVFAPYLRAALDYGITKKISVNFNSLGFPSDASVHYIGFDAGNPNIVYVATSYGVIKTTDGGYTWQTNAIRLPDDGFVFRMTHHPSIGGLLYLGGGRRVYVTRDGGTNVQLIGEIDRDFITSLALDIQGNRLFVGTTEGGIYALKLIGR